MEQTITVATFNDQGPAEALKDRFIDAGLHADLLDESGTQALWGLTTNPKAHMRVRVRKEEYERAKKLLADWDARDGVMREAVKCPQCGSSRIEYPQFSRQAGYSIAVSALAASRIIPREYYCETCQFTWPDKPEAVVDRDVLNWPKGSKI